MIPALLARLGYVRRRGSDAELIADAHRVLDAADVPPCADLSDRVRLLVAERDAARALNSRLLVRGIRSEDRADRAEAALMRVQAHARAMREPLTLPRFLVRAAA